MNTRRVKRQISANEEPPPPPKRQATGKPVSVSPTPLPKPKRTSKKTAANQGGRMTAVKGRAGAPRMTAVNGRPGAFMEPGKKQVGRKQGDNWQPPANAFNMGTRIAEAEAEAAVTLAGMAGMGGEFLGEFSFLSLLLLSCCAKCSRSTYIFSRETEEKLVLSFGLLIKLEGATIFYTRICLASLQSLSKKKLTS